MTHPLSSAIAPGSVLDGKFRIEKVLGQGAMGVVVSARHLRLDEDVAIKFLLPAALENNETVARFEREAQAAAKIRSEHVARVRDVGRLETGAPYMVMEHLSGVDLKQYLAQKGPLPVEEAMHYILQASEALAEAHSLGIVHRDLKPANMFRILRVDGSPSIKILDFGISKLQNADVSMTQTSTMMGSPYYMSPEQMTSSKDVDARTDIWAMGVIVHQLLTDSVPFEGNSIAEVCAAVLTQKAPRLSANRDDIPLGLQEVVDRALQKKRENRLSNMAHFAQALAPFGQSEDVLSAERVSRVLGFQAPTTFDPAGDQTTAAPPFEAATDRERTLEGAAHSQHPYLPRTKSSSGLVYVGVFGAALLGAVAFFASRGSDEVAPPSGASTDPTSAPVAEDVPSPTDAHPETSKKNAAAREDEPGKSSPKTTADDAKPTSRDASSTTQPVAKSPTRAAHVSTAAAAAPPEPPATVPATEAEPVAEAPPAAAPEAPPEAPAVDPLEYYRDRR